MGNVRRCRSFRLGAPFRGSCVRRTARMTSLLCRATALADLPTWYARTARPARRTQKSPAPRPEMREGVNLWMHFPLVLGRYPVPVLHPRAVSTPWLALVQPHTTLRLLGNGDGRRGTLRSWRKVVVGDPGASARLLGGGCRQRRACRGHLQAAREHACQDHPLRTQVWALCHVLKCRAHALFHLTRSGARCDAARNVRTASAGG